MTPGTTVRTYVSQQREVETLPVVSKPYGEVTQPASGAQRLGVRC
jgi:hypothetical protein